MTIEYIDSPDRARDAVGELGREPSLALDCEAAGFHRYSDRLCLVQISTPAGRDLIFDPLRVDLSDLLRPLLEDPGRRLVMHGGDYDFRLLDRDLGIRPRGLFDTQVAASLLGLPGLGLAALLEEHFEVRLSKKYQRADWAKRPLERGMLEYAAADTRYLHPLSARLADALEDTGRLEWAEEECRAMEEIRWVEDQPEDPVVRVKAARRMSPREVERLRTALDWRDEIARGQDRAPFRVSPDAALVDVAVSPPASVHELSARKGMNSRVVQSWGQDLVTRLREIDEKDDSALRGYPPPTRRGPGRPAPEVEELAEVLKRERNRTAEELGLDRGVLLSNNLLLEIVRAAPASRDELLGVEGVRQWQVEVLGDRLLSALG
ncbi:MAG: HRDC domain-containing protein [Gemmatimonadales bacterium]|nr:MAG: HRDC domain-containing protein [Gemmatimonadales bacterium]